MKISRKFIALGAITTLAIPVVAATSCSLFDSDPTIKNDQRDVDNVTIDEVKALITRHADFYKTASENVDSLSKDYSILKTSLDVEISVSYGSVDISGELTFKVNSIIKGPVTRDLFDGSWKGTIDGFKTPTPSKDKDDVDKITSNDVKQELEKLANKSKMASEFLNKVMPKEITMYNGVKVTLTGTANDDTGTLSFDVTSVSKGDYSNPNPSSLNGIITGFATNTKTDQEEVDSITSMMINRILLSYISRERTAQEEAGRIPSEVTSDHGVKIDVTLTVNNAEGKISYVVTKVYKGTAVRANPNSLNGDIFGFKLPGKTDQQLVNEVTAQIVKQLVTANVNLSDDAVTAAKTLPPTLSTTSGVTISLTATGDKAKGILNYFVSAVTKGSATKANPNSLNGTINGFNTNPTPPAKSSLTFSPYLDPSLSSAGTDLQNAEAATNNKLNSATFAFINRQSGSTNYSFAGKSTSDVKSLYSGITNFHPVLATGGVAAGSSSAGYVLPTMTSSDGVNQTPDQIASQFYSIIKDMNSNEFDWDIESDALTGDAQGVAKAAATAKLIQDKATADNYKLKQIITLPTAGASPQTTDPSTITKENIDAIGENEGFNAAGQKAIEDFYKAGVSVIANGMIMEYNWRTNYDVQALLEIGGMSKTIKRLNPSWNDDQVYGHIGITPMIGHQAAAPGVYTYTNGVKYTSQWAKSLKIGFIGFWSLTRDHPLKSGSWQNNPTSYGLADGSDYIYTKNFIQDLGL